jgi:hypothetical protein
LEEKHHSANETQELLGEKDHLAKENQEFNKLKKINRQIQLKN